MAESIWDSVVIPILETVARLETSIHGPDHEQVAKAAKLDVHVVAKELPSLLTGQYLSANESHDLANVYFGNLRLLERGKRQVGLWPSDESIYEQLLELLDRQMAQATAADQKKLGALKEAVIKAGPSIAITLGKAWLEHILGGRS